jgi:hypothetical protein
MTQPDKDNISSVSQKEVQIQDEEEIENKKEPKFDLATTNESNDLDSKNAFHKLDNAKLGWFHIRTCLVSGIGFFTDAYDLFIM